MTRLIALVQEDSNSKIIVTTHKLFPEEIDFIRCNSHKSSEFYSLDEFFADADGEKIDMEAASAVENAFSGEKNCLYEEYRSSMIHLRGKRFNDIAESSFHPDRWFHTPGLGISEDWGDGKSVNLSPKATNLSITKDKVSLPSCIFLIRSLFSRTMRLKKWVVLEDFLEVSHKGTRYIIVGSSERLRKRMTTVTVKRSGQALKRLNGIINSLKGNHQLCMPLHGYSPYNDAKILVLQDGHWPSNYTTGSLLGYRKIDVLIPSNPFGERWLQRSNHPAARISWFRDLPFSEPKPPKQISKVLFILNHAGDWSALIHRSDTCRMVLVAQEAAIQNPNMQIRLRPHPTMLHPAHEGPNSLKRIVQFIAVQSLPNFHVSTSSFADDIDWADIMVAEYSEMLIDSWRSGKLGVVFNPTRRRSFMADYEALGMPKINDVKELSEFQGSNGMRRLVEQQAAGADYFADLISRW